MANETLRIRYGFLDGNLNSGDMTQDEERAFAADYADDMRDALESAYPGAQVEVTHENAQGGSGAEINILGVEDLEDVVVLEMIEDIRNIAQTVYEGMNEWAGRDAR